MSAKESGSFAPLSSHARIAQRLLGARRASKDARASTGSLPNSIHSISYDDGLRRGSSSTIKSNDSGADELGDGLADLPGEIRPSPNIRRCVSFDSTYNVHEVFDADEYDRKAAIPSMELPLTERQKVFEELERYRKHEMQVHPDSKRTAIGRYPEAKPKMFPDLAQRRPSGTLKTPSSPKSLMRAMREVGTRISGQLDKLNPQSPRSSVT